MDQSNTTEGRISQTCWNVTCGAMIYWVMCCVFLFPATSLNAVFAADESTVVLPDESNPWYPQADVPALKTPDWVDEPGVEAVFVLAIDDMRDSAKYEQYLRPVLNRLKQLDGRAAVSIMSCSVRPDDPQLQSWLAEGLSIECHTIDHPCPILQGGDFQKAKSTYDRCVDLMTTIPGSSPVAFRTPCCDSLNTVSPRFFSEIFSQSTEAGHFLQLDSSVFMFYTSNDSTIPRELILDENGQERFLKYLPKGNKYRDLVHDNFVNYVRDYPYPWIINNSCWQIPCIAPSDWSAQHFHGVNNLRTVDDWKAAIDITVLKQGCFSLVFHPHGWIQAEQVVELIDHAVAKHGTKVRFLTFREVAEKLNSSLTNGKPLRDADAATLARLSHLSGRQTALPDAELPAEVTKLLQTSEHRNRLIRFLPMDDPDISAILLVSHQEHTEVWLTTDQNSRWTGPLAPHSHRLPPILRADGTHNGFFVHEQSLCWQNEDTSNLPDLIYRVTFDELLFEHRHHAARMALPPVPVGAAVVDITPDYPVRLTGYGNRTTESEGIAARIHARALVIGGTAVAGTGCNPSTVDENRSISPLSVLITVDNCGVPREITEAVFAQVAKVHNIDRAHFVIASTHTHSGPWLMDFAPQIFAEVPDDHSARLKQYETELIGQLVRVVDQAVQSRRNGRLSIGRGSVGFAVNRRALTDGQWSGFGENSDGPTDHQLPILAAHDEDGRLIAVLANYACHATTETGSFNQISGDWPGFAADLIETHVPGAVALIAIGTGADANPTPRGTHEQAQQHGLTLANEVLRLLGLRSDRDQQHPVPNQAEYLKPVDPQLVCQLDRIDLPLAPLPSIEEWQQRATQPGVPGAHARRFLKMLDQGQPIPTTIPEYPVQTWCFGSDLAMVFLGGEVVVDYSIRLNEMFDGSRLWINAWSNDVPCYIASKRLLREGGYEVDSSMLYYARPTRLAPEAEDLICDTVQRLLPHHFYTESLQVNFPAPKSPSESLASMTTRADLQVQLVAAEPLIRDPVAFDWDINGRLWVVEMDDYPNGRGSGSTAEAGGRIRVLEDVNQDGVYDTATTFLDGIGFPTGICCWRNGVIVTAAPDVFYAEDTNGDGAADLRTKLYTGFTEGNQQHRVNGLRWGLDGWLYLANGDSGGGIQAVGSTGSDSALPLNIRGRDLRIQPDQNLLDTLSGQTQFGRERDDLGYWFGNNNSNPIWQYVLEDRYLRRNPHAASSTARAEVAEVPGAAPVFPTSRTLARFNDFGSANRFTSACGTMIYRDTLLGDQYYGNAFISEPVHNLVSRLVMQRNGVHHRGRRADDEQESEFLASADNWFRPTMIRTGPDGALYIADMYRQVIEHPEWIPLEYQRKMNLQAGNDRGRIYRIVPAAACCADSSTAEAAEKTAAESVQQPVADHRAWFVDSWKDVSVTDLVARLASPNGWWRDTAHRMLLHRSGDADHGQRQNQSTDAASELTGELQTLARTHHSDVVRMHALCVLQTLSGQERNESCTAALLNALKDQSVEVRRQAIRLLEPELRQAEFVLPAEFADLVTDPDDAVVLQLASSLGESARSEAAVLLARILRIHGDNPWIVSAAMSSLNRNNISTVLLEWTTGRATDALPGANNSVAVLGRLIGQAAAFEQQDAVRQPFQSLLLSLDTPAALSSTDIWMAAIEAIRQIRRYGTLNSKVSEAPEVLEAWNSANARALSVAMQPEADSEVRSACINFAIAGGLLRADQTLQLLELLNLKTPINVQQAVVSALSHSEHADVAEQLLERWQNFGPTLRSSVLDILLQKKNWTSQLLDRLSAETLNAADLDAVRRERLLTHRDEAIRRRATELLATQQISSRAELIDMWRDHLAGTTGDTERGRLVFEKRCAACHRLQGIGRSIGADLEALRDRSSEGLLTAILDPNRAVESKFLSYTAVTVQGLSVSGMLLSETGNSLTLIAADGKEHVVVRADLEELISSSRSLMPEGLERDLSVQDMADVIAFVQSSGRPWKRFAGNEPQVVTADADGVITLPASAAEIYGPRLEFEETHANLGWWQSTEDYAVWTFEAKRSGHYTVEFEYACDNSTAGNLIRLSTGTRLLSARVPGTGTWDNYSRWTAGTLDVHGGRGRLTVTAAEPPSAHLIDLRSIRLIPPSK